MDSNLVVNIVLTVWLLLSIVLLTFVEGFTVWAKIPTISARLQGLGEHVKLVRFLATVAVIAFLIHFFYPGL